MREAVSVTILNRYIKDMFMQERMLSNIYVKGEVSNFKESHGNYYFSLKDDTSSISCIYFAKYNDDVLKNINDGSLISVKGKVSVYEKNGTYSIYVNSIENSGLGEYYIKLNELKKKLLELGMFDESYKKPIPKYSMNIGVVTAKSGAAIRDIEKTIKDKNPYASITLYPALVQGDKAYESIVDGIMTLDKMNLDVIIIGRGGGSIEDLYCFNDERVAYAIFNAKTPIISAVGHEINDSISDLVADVRVATPTAAGEMATFDYYEFCDDLKNYKMTLSKLLSYKIDVLKEKIETYNQKISFLSPREKVIRYRDKIDNDKKLLKNRMTIILNDTRAKVVNYIGMLKNYDVLDKLGKGMLYTTNDKGRVIKSVKDVKLGDKLKLRAKDGTIKAKVC